MAHEASPTRGSIKVSADTHAGLMRLARLHGKPLAQLLEQVRVGLERWWQERMTACEWQSYVDDNLGNADARGIIQRERDIDGVLDSASLLCPRSLADPAAR